MIAQICYNNNQIEKTVDHKWINYEIENTLTITKKERSG